MVVTSLLQPFTAALLVTSWLQLQHSFVSGSTCMEYVNLRHADLGEQTCSSNKENGSMAYQSCLSVVLRVTEGGFQPNGETWNITEGSDNSSLLEDYEDEASEVANGASEIADDHWASPFLLDTERDGEPHVLNVSNGNDSETQYIFVTALRTCWPSDDMNCYAKHCIVVLTNLAIANNSRWFVCCCTGPHCNQRTYIVHESGLKRSAAGVSAAYTTFRARVLKAIARRLRLSDDEVANILIESARRGVQQHSSRGSSLASRLMASFNLKESAMHNVTQSDASSDSETLQTTFSMSDNDSDNGFYDFSEVREFVVSAFVVLLICALLLLASVHFFRKRTSMARAHVRVRRRRQTSTRSLERSESVVPVALSPYFAKRQERFVFKRAALRCEELVARGRFCSVWRGALLRHEVAANMNIPVAVKVFERQARTVWANEAAVYAHLIEYASSRPELRYAETCSWDELWGVGTANAQSSYSSQSVSTKCETTASTCTSETATEQLEERNMRDALSLLGSVSILRFVGVCIDDPREDDDDDRTDLLSIRLGCSYQLVTEYQSLGSLNDFLQRHLLTWHDALRVAHGIAAGLSFLHRSDEAEYAAYVPASTSFPRVGKAPIAHRDVKSKNILLRADLHASICDFGLALILDDTARAQLDESSNSALLQCGTRVYMSPELLTAVTKMTRESFIATDVYAFALVLYELLTRIAELRCVQTIISPQAGRCSESESAIAMDSEEDSRGRRMTNALCPVRACTAANSRAAAGCACGRNAHERCAKTSVYEHGVSVSFDEDVQSQCAMQQTNAAYAPETTESVVDISRRSARFRPRATLQHEYDCDCDCVPFACTYRLPFTRETGCSNPDLETLRRLVATQNYRPPLVEFDREAVRQADETQLCAAGRCFVGAVREYSRTVEQSWDVDADARLSAATICVRLKRLLRDCDGDGDAACRCALRFIRSRK